MKRPLVASLALSLLAGCSGARGAGPHRTPTPPATRPSEGKIEGEVERSPAQRMRMRIWGQVERIRQGQHGQLPPLTTTATGGIGDPVTEIRNQTSAPLTIWFAGKCSHEVEVPPGAKVTAVFCPGPYNLAAMLDNAAFLPLVRENQDFLAGVSYRLDFYVKKAPR